MSKRDNFLRKYRAVAVQFNARVNPPTNGLVTNFERGYMIGLNSKNRTLSWVGAERIVLLFQEHKLSWLKWRPLCVEMETFLMSDSWVMKFDRENLLKIRKILICGKDWHIVPS